MSGVRTDWPTTATEEAEWDAIAAAFMNDPEETYFNSGSWGVMARPTFDALVAALRERELNPTAKRKVLLAKVRESRRQLAAFMQAPAEDVAFMTNVTVAINTVVNGFDWRAGDEIVTSNQEYGAIRNCLHNAHQRWGVTVREAKIPIPPGSQAEVLAPFAEAITDRTRLVVCSHITSGTGLIVPIEQLIELAHARGALIAIDGAHAPGMIPLDLPGLGCDFYGGNCHKWLCSPKGVGFLYAAPAVQEQMQHLIVSWGYSRDGTTRDDSGGLQINGRPYMWGIEALGTFSIASQVATGAAVQFQQDIGSDRIARRGRKLAGYLRDRMATLEWAELMTPTDPAMSGLISSFRLHGFDGAELGKAMYDRYKITLPIGRGKGAVRMRVSTHIYNTFAQIDRLVDALVTLRREGA